MMLATTIQITPFVFFIAAIMMSSPTADAYSPSRNRDVMVAIGEMQKANYFTFVMLINMAPPDLFQGNFTFLMPNDRALSRAIIPDSDVVNFLLRHSIPSTLLFEYLQHFPTGSLIPSSNPDLMLRVTNRGRRQFFLNNSRLISPNICTRGLSIRCHGIDGVLQATETMANDPSVITPPPPPPPHAPALPPAPTSRPPITGLDPNPVLVPPPADSSYKINSGERWGSLSMGDRMFGLMSVFMLFL